MPRLFPLPGPPRFDRPRARLAAGLALLLLALAATFAAVRLDAADPPARTEPITGGTLLLSAKGVARTMPATRLGTDMDVSVSGQIARVRVTQAFRNTSADWMEATYLYPLPDNGAVDTLRMVVGQRVIVGRIKRRVEARKIYEDAKAQGKKAGLVEQERPNMFRTSVANVGPGETVLVQIEYQASVRQQGGEFSLRLPLVVGPRYVPAASPAGAAGEAGADEARLPPAPDPAPDPAQATETDDEAEAVVAPLAAPDLGRSLNPVSITVRLAPGFEPANLISPYHKVAIGADGPGRRIVRLADGSVPADRDFELRWRSAAADPTLALFRQTHEGKTYVMASITPPAAERIGALPPREMIFVIDNSGSMAGDSMVEAKNSLLHALTTLRPQDRFNIIRFDDTMSRLFDTAVAATPDRIAQARRFTEGLEADGGTEMLPALNAALEDPTPDSPMLRQLIFLTDGAISNERDMLAAIRVRAGRSRLFMVGIGSAPNSFLMTRMAEVGRGGFTYIGSAAEVPARMTALLDRLKAPAVRDLKVAVSGPDLALTPAILPDLYAGEPLVLLGRADRPAGRLTVTGRIGDKPWKAEIDLDEAVESPAVARLWARRTIEDVEVARWTRSIADDEADAAVAALGLVYGLVTSQTSLVAVDDTPSRPAGQALKQEELPLLLPAGWDFDTLLGGVSARAALANEAALAARQAEAAADPAEPLDLPETATGFLGYVALGLLLIALGLCGLGAIRRQTRRATL